MGIIIVKAKCLLMNEDDLEIKHKGLEGVGFKSEKWLVRRKALDTEDIYDVTAYKTNKCLITFRDETQLLVMEPFDDVVAKWAEVYTPNEDPENEENEEENNVEGENNNEDEDE